MTKAAPQHPISARNLPHGATYSLAMAFAKAGQSHFGYAENYRHAVGHRSPSHHPAAAAHLQGRCAVRRRGQGSDESLRATHFLLFAATGSSAQRGEGRRGPSRAHRCGHHLSLPWRDQGHGGKRLPARCREPGHMSRTCKTAGNVLDITTFNFRRAGGHRLVLIPAGKHADHPVCRQSIADSRPVRRSEQGVQDN